MSKCLLWFHLKRAEEGIKFIINIWVYEHEVEKEESQWANESYQRRITTPATHIETLLVVVVGSLSDRHPGDNQPGCFQTRQSAPWRRLSIVSKMDPSQFPHVGMRWAGTKT